MMVWTTKAVEGELVRAAFTLRNLPEEKGPAKLKACWPESRAEWQDYPMDFTKMPRYTPSSREIDSCIPALDWLLHLSDIRDRRIVMSALILQSGEVGRVPWTKLKNITGIELTRQRLRQIYKKSLFIISCQINRG